MEFRDCIQTKGYSLYRLAKESGIPYATLFDLASGKTLFSNMSLRHASSLGRCLGVHAEELLRMEAEKETVEFRYFRNSTLQELLEEGDKIFCASLISSRRIDSYYKKGQYAEAYYLLALLDVLCRENQWPIYEKRYGKLRKEKLSKVLFVGSDLFAFSSIAEAKARLRLTPIEEFARHNIVEDSIRNVC